MASHTSTYRFQRYYHSLQSGHYLLKQSRRQEPVRVFFQQGDVDGACGLYVLLSVLVIFDLAKSVALIDLATRKFGVPAQVWKVFKHTYFAGVEPKEYVQLIDTMKLPLIVTLKEADSGGIDRWVTENLMRGELVAIAMASVKNRRTKHWCLCVGCEGIKTGRDTTIDTLLLLDPSSSEPTFNVANSRLRIPQKGHGSRSGKVRAELKKTNGKPVDWIHEGADVHTEPMRLIAAVRFRLAEWP